MKATTPTCISLYYPFIQFRSDSWIKLAALYWDKVGRIVPRGYLAVDSDTVHRLDTELGFIENFPPDEHDLYMVGHEFLELVNRRGAALARRYGLRTLSEPASKGSTESARWWKGQFDPSVPAGEDPRLAYIYTPKVSGELQAALTELGLSRPAPQDAVAMHPKLAFVYMEALASRMATARQLHPLTDNDFDHAAAGCSVDRIEAALLPDTELPSGPTQDLEIEYALLAIESVIPKDIANVPVQKIIDLRRQHGDELVAFQDHARRLSEELQALASISDPDAVQAHLDAAYRRTLAPHLENLRKQLGSLRIDTALSALSIKVGVPALVSSGATLFGVGLTHLNPILLGGGAIALALAPVARGYQRKRDQTIHQSPAAYLFRLQEGLRPARLSSALSRQTRRFERAAAA